MTTPSHPDPVEALRELVVGLMVHARDYACANLQYERNPDKYTAQAIVDEYDGLESAIHTALSAPPAVAAVPEVIAEAVDLLCRMNEAPGTHIRGSWKTEIQRMIVRLRTFDEGAAAPKPPAEPTTEPAELSDDEILLPDWLKPANADGLTDAEIDTLVEPNVFILPSDLEDCRTREQSVDVCSVSFTHAGTGERSEPLYSRAQLRAVIAAHEAKARKG